MFKANPEYNGPNKAQTPNFIVQYFDQPSALKLAIESGEVDVAYRTLSPTDLEDLRNKADQGVKVVDGAGTEIRYIVFNVEKEPVKDAGRPQGDRPEHRSRRDRGDGLQGHGDAAVLDGSGRVPGRQEVLQGGLRRSRSGQGQGAPRRGRRLDPGRARRLVHAEPYGAAEADMWNEIKRQLDATNLFKVNLDSTEWDQYKEEAFTKGTYYFYGLGWFPDFPDADNYLTPFMRDGGFFANGYSNKEVNALLDEEIATDDAAAREEAFGKVQDIQAEDVPVIPLWEGKQVAAVREGVEGVEKTFDPAFLFRFWLVTKKES